VPRLARRIECREAVNPYEDNVTVEFAKDVLDFLYEDSAILRRPAQRDDRPQDNGSAAASIRSSPTSFAVSGSAIAAAASTKPPPPNSSRTPCAPWTCTRASNSYE